MTGQSPTFGANRLRGLAGSSVARSGGTPLVVVAYMVVRGSLVAGTVGTFVVLVARIVGFAGVGVVAQMRGRSRSRDARRPVTGDVGVGRRELFAGGEVKIEILGHPTIIVW